MRKKILLVKWNIIHLPKVNGGLVVKDPLLMNISLGAKIIWMLISDSNEWWKMDFICKYLKKNRISREEEVQSTNPGFQIWKLCKEVPP